MILYRIYTEDVNREKVQQICLEELSDFTITAGTGYWNRCWEQCVVIDVIGRDQERDAVLRAASRIKTTSEQESVIVTETGLDHVWCIGKDKV